MSYVVLARKWRPMRFEDLVGQDHVARTLGNAIEAGRVAHAFLFTGVRGVGKTTSARIMAKALNCMGKPGSVPAGTDPGPTIQPCLECPACKEIAAGTDVDVREIDGATYNGVEKVRELQESLPYRPSRDRYKVVIVDEVHMLSNSAWNAFLKTLEEPPPHVKFIFATTEVHKIPVTILSRVQRFDFKLITTRAIGDRIRYVLEQEGVAFDDQAVDILALEAAGSMRDALSLLDQVIAFGGERMTAEVVAQVLGVAPRQLLHDLARGLVQGDAATCLRLVGQVSDQGFDIPHFTSGFLSLLRDLVVTKVVPQPAELLDLSDSERGSVDALVASAGADDLLRLHQGFSKGYDDVVRSSSPRAALEMLLVRLARRPPLWPVDDLVQRLTQLERRLAGGISPQARGREGESRPARGGAAPSGGRDEPPSGPERREVDAPLPPAQSPPRSPDLASTRLPTAPAAASTSAAAARRVASPAAPPEAAARPRDHGTSTRRDVTASAALAELDDEPPPWLFDEPDDPAPWLDDFAAPAPKVAPQRIDERPNAPAPPRRSSNGPSGEAPFQPPFPVDAPKGGRDSAPAPAPLPSATPEEEARLARLKPVVDQVRGLDIELAAYLEQCTPLVIEPGRLELAFEPKSLFVERVAEKETFERLRHAAAAALNGGQPVDVRLARDHGDALPHKTLAALRIREREAERRAAIARAKAHPRVVDALEVFNARIKDVKLPEG